MNSLRHKNGIIVPLLKQFMPLKLNSKSLAFLSGKTYGDALAINKQNTYFVQTSDRREMSWTTDRKAGYRTIKDVSTKQHIIDGFKQLKKEIILWKEEVKEHLRADPTLIYRPGETDVLWSFSNDKDMENFIATSDSDFAEGRSQCTFTKSPAGYGIFSGTLDSTVPAKGTIKRAGYCNISSKRVKKSFQRDTYYDWSAYNTLILRVRGDGRPYLLVLTNDGYFDITWHDAYHFVLYTRGGPHWQLARIPFSKFFLGAKGRVQDKQEQLTRYRVSRFGITAAGATSLDGKFSLEIDYVGLEYDPSSTEAFAYEMYQVPKYIIGQA